MSLQKHSIHQEIVKNQQLAIQEALERSKLETRMISEQEVLMESLLYCGDVELYNEEGRVKSPEKETAGEIWHLYDNEGK